MTHNQNVAFKARFDSLGSKFNGKTLDDYVNGQSFCCSDNSLDEIEKNNTQTSENAKLEDNLYFYHPDHLGSTSMVTNYDGEVTQNVAYIPYGEVFVEERNGSWATPFLFNAKELDEETGLYYYGARYYDPTNVAWLSVDPMFEEEAGKSPYSYCAGNPIRYTDPTGMLKMANYSDEELSNLGLTREELARFESLVKNIGNIVNNNKDALSAISSTTGLTEEQIKNDMVFGEGPTINLHDGGAFCSGENIYINIQSIKDLSIASSTEKIAGKSYTKLDEQCLLSSMTILHEYGHYGDQKTNGTNTGQYTIEKGVKKPDLGYGMIGLPSTEFGKQNWKESKTGHRGDDVTFIGYGVTVFEKSGHLKLDAKRDYSKLNKVLNSNLHNILRVK